MISFVERGHMFAFSEFAALVSCSGVLKLAVKITFCCFNGNLLFRFFIICMQIKGGLSNGAQELVKGFRREFL